MFELPIVRLYRSAEHAERAMTALRRWGFEPERILRISPAATTHRDDVVGTLRAAALPEWSARHYADAVRDGRTLLVVHAPFGTGGHAEDLLEEGAPVAPEVEPFRRHLLPSNDAAPMSEALGLPTLARRGRTTSEALGIPALTRPRTYVASRAELGDDPAPFSRLLHLPVLTRRGRTLSEALGIPALTRSRTYVASRAELSDNPAPFSRLLHLPVLLRDRIAGRASPHVVRREVLRGDTSPSAGERLLPDVTPQDDAGAWHRTAPSRARAMPGGTDRSREDDVTRIG